MKLKTLTIVACMVTASFACLSTAQAADDANKNPTFTKYAPWKGQGQLGSVTLTRMGIRPSQRLLIEAVKHYWGCRYGTRKRCEGCHDFLSRLRQGRYES